MKKFILGIIMLCIVPFVSNAQGVGDAVDPTVGDDANFVKTDVLSQEALDEVMSGNDWEVSKQINDVDCFDYYKFQSVQVSLGTEKDYYKPGETVHVSGKIINENNQPITNGNVFVRVSQKNGNSLEEGNFIVDEFVAIDDISLKANESKSASFDWTIPKSSSSSDYIFDYFFSVGKKFNLGGLPFSNEITAGTASFNVITKQKAFISFDRSKTKVNNQKYFHIGNWPIVENNSNVLIEQPIINTFKEDKKVDITYDVYYWDSLNEKDLLNSSKEQITIPSNDSVNLKYTITDINESVYYVKITAVSGDQKSIANVRFVNNVEKPRLNYPAITKFPINKGDDVTLFTCFHNTTGISANGKVVVKLIDLDDKKDIANINYEGAIPPSMSADKTDFVAAKKYDHLALKAQMFNNKNKLIDEYEVNYNCEDFDSCDSHKKGSEASFLNNAKYVLFGLSAFLFVSVLIFFGIKRYKQK